MGAARCEWLVPGLLREKVKALAKAMPQRLRHKLGALDEFADRFAAGVSPGDTPLGLALARYIRAEINLEVPADAFRPDSAPPHLRMNFRVLDEHGRQLAMGRDLGELKRELSKLAQSALQEQSPVPEGERYTGWTFGDLDEIMEIRRGGHTLVGYPALVDAADAVTLQVFDSPEKAQQKHCAGVKRLLAIAFRERIRDIEKAAAKDMALGPLKDDLVSAALARTFLAESLPTTQADFARRVDEGRSRLSLIAQELQRLAATILAGHAQVQKRIGAAQKTFAPAAEDVRGQCARLLAPGWLARTPWERLQHLPRYLEAAALRLEKLRADPGRDARLMGEIHRLQVAWQREMGARTKQGAMTPELEQYGWLLEELRVSLFAQELKTPVPVSAKRLSRLWQSMRK